MTCFWWHLTRNITVHITRLSLKESCLKINVKKVQFLLAAHLATHPKSGSCGSRGIRLLIFLLFVLETSQYPSGLCLEEVTLFVRLDGEHPLSGTQFFRLTFLMSMRSKNPRCQPSICTPNVLLHQTVCSILVLLELMLPFVHGISSWILFLLPFHKCPNSVGTCLWFDRQLLLELRLLCCPSRWSFH